MLCCVRRYIVLGEMASAVERALTSTVHLPDGEELVVDWATPAGGEGLTQPAPTVVFLHGITGSTESVATFVRMTVRRGWHAVVVNRRGHSGPLKVRVHRVRRRLRGAWPPLMGFGCVRPRGSIFLVTRTTCGMR